MEDNSISDMKVFCGNCGTELVDDINCHIYRYIDPETGKRWCDICASRTEIDDTEKLEDASEQEKIRIYTKAFDEFAIKNPEGCWGWSGMVFPNGYARLKRLLTDHRPQAHRIAWNIYKGIIPMGMFVCHNCGNRICCNPDHLYLSHCQSDALRAEKTLWRTKARPFNPKTKKI